MSLLTSTDQPCLFCAGSLSRYPLVDGPAEAGDRRTAEILWSRCLECGFSVPTSTPDAGRVFGDREAVERSLDRGRAILVLPPEAAVHFHPASPSQIVRACREAGFREVHLELLGDELVAARYLDRWRESGPAETWIRSTSELVVRYLRLRHPALLDRLMPVVTPAEAAARHLLASAGDEEDDPPPEVVHAGLGFAVPGGRTSYLPFTLSGLGDLLADRELEPDRMPDEPAPGSTDAMVRRRHLSVPGGLPRAMLDQEAESSPRFHRVRDLEGLTEIARALEAGEEGFGFVDALPFESPLVHPALADAEPRDLSGRRDAVAAWEGPRSDEPVVEPAEGLDLSTTCSEEELPPPPALEVEDMALMLTRMGVRTEDLTGRRRALSTCPYRMGDRYQDALEDTLHDPITGVLSHEAFRMRFEEEVSRVNRYGARMALLLVDLDDHEEVVEAHGRGGAEAVMQKFGEIVLRTVRESDVVGRTGTDRMGVILIDPDPEGVAKVGEKILRRLASSETVHRGEAIEPGTASVGIAYHSGDARETLTAEDLFAEADASLYIARAQGGNRAHPSTSEELTIHDS